MTYTLPNGNETIAELYTWAATTTDGVSSIGIMLIVAAVVFFGTQRFGGTVPHSLLLAVTAANMVGGALLVMGALTPLVMSISVILLALSYWYASQD